MRKMILLGLLLTTIVAVSAQNASDSIEVKKGRGTSYLQGGKVLTPKQLLDITQPVPEAHAEMKVAKSNYNVATVLGFAGGFLIGWPLGTAIAGGDPEWVMAGIGAGLVGISIPLLSAYNKRSQKAVDIYNSTLQQTGYNRMDLKLGVTCNGLGLRMTF